MTKNLKKFGLILSLSLFAISGVVYAGTLTPSVAPAATSYTLSDIYTRLTTNASATSGNHDFAPGGSPAASLYTLTQLYDAIPTIVAGNVFSGISYLGVTGTLDLTCNTATFNGTANLVATAYDGSGDGTNRWCMTSSGDAVAGNILSGKIAWVDGLAVTGTIPTQTLAVANDTVSAGYYDATTLSAVDTDLATDNIKSGITIFGFAGNSNVVNTSTGDAVAGDILSGKIAWVDGLAVTGTIATQTLSAANDTVSAGYYNATTLSAVDADLATGNILAGKTIFGFAGTVYPAKSLKTNQTICYDAAGSVVACSGTGQDGELLKGVARSYTDNSDGTITDNSTGLVWQKCSDGLSGATCATGAAATATWANALSYCNANTAALPGSGWRLPNVYELYSLVDFGVAAAPFINATYFPATVSSAYWSSTSRPASFTVAMDVSFLNGVSSFNTKASADYVRCVRG